MRKYRVSRTKIKRYRGSPLSFRKGPRPVVVAAVLAGIIALICIGVVLFRPIYDAVMQFGESLRSGEPTSQSESVSEPESEPQSNPEPEPEPPKPLSDVSAAQLPYDTAADPDRLAAFLDSLPAGANAVMFDIKNSGGDVLFQTANTQADAWGAVAAEAIDLRALADTLAEKDLRLIARIYAFRDPLAAAAGREECAVMFEDTDHIWIDAALESGGKPWLNPYLPLVREYVISLAREAVDQGADMIVLAGVRFPDASRIQANFGPDAETVSRLEMLVRFLDEFSAAIRSDTVRVAVELPAVDIASQANWDVRYGGSPLDLPMSDLLLDVTPAQSGEEFAQSGDPAETAKTAADYTEAQLESGSGRKPGLLLLLHEEQQPGAGSRETIIIEQEAP